MVAVFPDSSHGARAFRREHSEHFARRGRGPRDKRPRVAGGWHAFIPVLERGDEREAGPSWYILLLEGGAPPASQCSTASRDRRDKARVRRTRGRIFYHAFGNAVGGERQDVRRLFPRRSGRPSAEARRVGDR